MSAGGLAGCLNNSTGLSRSYEDAVGRVKRIVKNICGSSANGRRYVKNKRKSLFGKPAGCYLTEAARLRHLIGGEPLLGPFFRIDARGWFPAVAWVGDCHPSKGTMQELLRDMDRLIGASEPVCERVEQELGENDEVTSAAAIRQPRQVSECGQSKMVTRGVVNELIRGISTAPF
ncbi:hypothetical protein ERJ75_000401700 [Trypanosoma vivax]|nr:hypothetical protein ERJ75_000401700 [Trypanosoma vivax]